MFVDCDENSLKKIFPDLYKRVDPDGVNWPAKVENITSKNSSTEWTVGQNGNIINLMYRFCQF